MSSSPKAKPDIKLVTGFLIALLALAGGVVATIFIRPENPPPNDNEAASIVREDDTKKEDLDHDIAALKLQAEKVEKLYTRLDQHINKRYGKEVKSISFADDAEAQAIMTEFIVAIDELDQVIADSSMGDIKFLWKGFREPFDKRRDHIVLGINEEEDGGWALELIGVYLFISSKVSE